MNRFLRHAAAHSRNLTQHLPAAAACGGVARCVRTQGTLTADDAEPTALLDCGAGFEIDLRQHEHCAGPPEFAGFDVFALRFPMEELLTATAQRCDRLGIQHTQIAHFPGYGAGMDIPDPDETLVRIV